MTTPNDHAQRLAQEAERLERARAEAEQLAAFYRDFKPIGEELRAAGVEFGTVVRDGVEYDDVGTLAGVWSDKPSADLHTGFDVIEEWILKTPNVQVQRELIAMLQNPSARGFDARLLALLEAHMLPDEHAAFAAADVLARCGATPTLLPRFASVVRDVGHPLSVRRMMLDGMTKLALVRKHPLARGLARELSLECLGDPRFALEALTGLVRLKAPAPLALIEPLTLHREPEVRKKARRLLEITREADGR